MAAPNRVTAAVPVLLVTGPVGVGKTVVTGEAARLLSEAGIPHAMADLAVIGACWPPPADDRWNEELIHANLGACGKTSAGQAPGACCCAGCWRPAACCAG